MVGSTGRIRDTSAVARLSEIEIAIAQPPETQAGMPVLKGAERSVSNRG
jgi:hypothetical protein